MSEEKKNERIALNDDELEQVTGGAYSKNPLDQYTEDSYYPRYPEDYYLGSH